MFFRTPEETEAPIRTEPWKETFEDWAKTDRRPVVEPGVSHSSVMDSVSRRLRRAAVRRSRGLRPVDSSAAGDLNAFVVVDQDVRDDLTFVRFYPRSLLVLDRDGAFVGGAYDGNVWVEPEHRRTGIATALHVVVVESALPTLEWTTSYAPAALEARRSAHEVICRRAFERGEDVHPGMIDRYGLVPRRDPSTGP